VEDGGGRIEWNFGNGDLLDSEFGCCLKKGFKLAKTCTVGHSFSGLKTAGQIQDGYKKAFPSGRGAIILEYM